MMCKKPNIIYVVAHDLGRHLSCYGKPIHSPTLDRFADRGVKFTNAFCNAPACSPSRACAMTGQYSHRNGLMGLVNGGWSLPLETQTIVDYLNRSGYETAHFGLQHERWSAAANRYQIEGRPEKPGLGPQILTENAMTEAIQYLEGKQGSSQPFYLNIGTIEVHCSMWGMKPDQGRWQVYGVDPPERVYLPESWPDSPVLREHMGRFQGAIRFLDSHFQRLMNAIDSLGFRENTLVIFTTDHGIAGYRAKTTLYDLGVEIALLMQMPGTIGEGKEIPDLVQNIDVVPTLLEAAGVEIPSEVQGKSFWKHLTGGNYDPHDAIFMERNYHSAWIHEDPRDRGEPHPGWDPMRAIRTEQFHYIRNLGDDLRRDWLPHEMPSLLESYETWFTDLFPPCPHPRDKEELYDIQSDPWELNNLADNPKFANARKELAGQLDQWMRDTDDPVLQGPIPDRLNGWPERVEAPSG